MRFMILTFQNIKHLFLRHPFLLLLLLAVQVICCVEIFISCGMAYNLNYTKKAAEQQRFGCGFDTVPGFQTEIIKDEKGNFIRCVYIPKDPKGEGSGPVVLENAIPIGEAKEKIEQLLSETQAYKPKLVKLELCEGRVLNQDEILSPYYQSYHPTSQAPPEFAVYLNSTDKVILAPYARQDGSHSPLCNFFPGETYSFGGEAYTLAGTSSYTFIPYHGIPQSFVLEFLKVEYEQSLTANDIENIHQSMEKLFGQYTTETYLPEPYDPEEVHLSLMLFVISIVVMVVVLLAISKLYSYILSTRYETLAIVRLCGCTRAGANLIYLAEILLTMAVTTFFGWLLFRFVCFEPIAEMYPAFDEFFVPSVYIAIVGIYLMTAVMILTVTVNLATRMSVKEMIR